MAVNEADGAVFVVKDFDAFVVNLDRERRTYRKAVRFRFYTQMASGLTRFLRGIEMFLSICSSN